MDSDAARAAQTLADYALLLLAAGIVFVGLAVAAVVAAARLARRFREPLSDAALWIFRQLTRIPFWGR